MATHWTSGSCSIDVRSYVQRGPMPMTPRVIFSLGATAPSRPRARAGTIVATAAAAAAAAPWRTKSRRFVAVEVEGVGMAKLLDQFGSARATADDTGDESALSNCAL